MTLHAPSPFSKNAHPRSNTEHTPAYVYVLAAGFGFSTEFWKPLISFLDAPSTHRIVYLEDLANASALSSAALYKLCPELHTNHGLKVVGIGHSLGFLKLLQSSVTWDAVIGLNGFTAFLGHAEFLKRARFLEHKAFVRAFRQNAYACMTAFYQRCGVPDKDLEGSAFMHPLLREYFNAARPPQAWGPAAQATDEHFSSLFKDLDLMRTKISCHVPVCIINNARDSVVPLAVTYDNFQGSGRTEGEEFKNHKLVLHILPHTHHILGYSHAHDVHHLIQRFLSCVLF